MKRVTVIILLSLAAFLVSCSDYSFTITGTWILQNGTWSDGYYTIIATDVEYLTLGTYKFCRMDIRDASNVTKVDVFGTWIASKTQITFDFADAPFNGNTQVYNYSLSGDTLTISDPSDSSNVLTFKKQW